MIRKLKLLLLAVSLASLSIPSVGVAEEESIRPVAVPKEAMHGGHYQPSPDGVSEAGNAAGFHVEPSNPQSVREPAVFPNDSNPLQLTDLLPEEEGVDASWELPSAGESNW
ncbi:hypothetical protein [Hutsoniella sourekii]|uniref:hypothetical protein n=1 Tax=Hutsoniella sourekii TaxID=87650 RepID=UPI000487F003|nr:hypothetical protein [Hutsoniella sourekii]